MNLRAVQARGSVLVLWAALAVFVLWPLFQLIAQTFTPAPGESANAWHEAFAQPVALKAIWGTVWLTALSLVFAVPVALLLAWITACTDAPGARRLALLPTLGLAISPLVGAIGWLTMTAPRVGSVNLLLRAAFDLHMDTGPLDANSLTMIVMLTSLYIVPYIYAPAHAAFHQVDASLAEAGMVCGGTGRAVLATLLFPLLRPAILAGALIGGVMAAAMFAIPLILASDTGLHVIPSEIYHLLQQEGRPAPAMALATLLTAATVLAMAGYARALRRAGFVTVTGKGARPLRSRLGAWRWPATAFVLVFLLFAMVLPLASLIHLSLAQMWGRDLWSQPLGFRAYVTAMQFPAAVEGLVNSAWLSAAGASLALVIGATISWRRARLATRFDRALAFVGSLPLGVPSIVLGLAFLVAFTGGWFPLYGSAAILVLAYAAHALPIALRSSDAGLAQVSTELEEAAEVCGDSRAGVLVRIAAPLLRRPLIAAWGIVFIILFRDISISILLYTPKTVPSTVALLQLFDLGDMPATAAYSIIVTAVSAGVVALLLALNTRTAGEA
jgi:iron(III) transport system permease protein